MNRFLNKSHGAVLFCCAITLLLPLPAYAQEAGNKSGQDEAMQKPAGKLIEIAGDATRDMRMHMILESKLAQNDNLSALSIDTDVENGEAYLRGEVQTGAERQLAAELASNIDGITDVQNDLVVKSAEPGTGEKFSRQASDASVTARVKSRLMLSNNTSGLAIDVDTENNIVTLRGEVSSDTERELAGLIAGNTTGVTGVRNKLELRPR